MKKSLIILSAVLSILLLCAECAPRSGKVSRKKYKWSYNNTVHPTNQHYLV